MSSQASMRGCSRDHGFTLIELLVVMAVLAILAMATFPLAEVAVQRDRERELKRALWEIRDAIDAYKRAVDSGQVAATAGSPGYPASLEVLVLGVADAKVPGQRQTFLRRVPRDPFAPGELPAAKSWGLRSFQSSANAPQPGSDVYDVYSLSSKLGLNGLPLREW